MTASTFSSAATSSRHCRKASPDIAAVVSTGPATAPAPGTSVRSLRTVIPSGRCTARPRSAHASGQGGRGRVRRGRVLVGRESAGVHGEHGYPGPDPARRPGELAGIAERLDVQHGQLGHLVLFPPQEHVVAGDVELAADRRERGDADAEPRQLIHHRQADAAGLHDQPGDAGPWVAGGEGGVEAQAGHRDAEGVRPDQPNAVSPAHSEQIGAGGGVQAGGDHGKGLHAEPAAVFGDVEDRRGGYRDQGQVRRFRQICHRQHTAHPPSCTACGWTAYRRP